MTGRGRLQPDDGTGTAADCDRPGAASNLPKSCRSEYAKRTSTELARGISTCDTRAPAVIKDACDIPCTVTLTRHLQRELRTTKATTVPGPPAADRKARAAVGQALCSLFRSRWGRLRTSHRYRPLLLWYAYRFASVVHHARGTGLLCRGNTSTEFQTIARSICVLLPWKVADVQPFTADIFRTGVH